MSLSPVNQQIDSNAFKPHEYVPSKKVIVLSGAACGAIVGAAAGSVFGPLGSLAGAVAGAVVGTFAALALIAMSAAFDWVQNQIQGASMAKEATRLQSPSTIASSILKELEKDGCKEIVHTSGAGRESANQIDINSYVAGKTPDGADPAVLFDALKKLFNDPKNDISIMNESFTNDSLTKINESIEKGNRNEAIQLIKQSVNLESDLVKRYFLLQNAISQNHGKNLMTSSNLAVCTSQALTKKINFNHYQIIDALPKSKRVMEFMIDNAAEIFSDQAK